MSPHNTESHAANTHAYFNGLIAFRSTA